MINQTVELKMNKSYEIDAGYYMHVYDILADDEEAGSIELVYKEDLDEQYVDYLFVEEDFRGQRIATKALDLLVEIYEFIYFAAEDEYSQSLYEQIAEEYNGENYEVDQGYGVFFIEKW